MLHQIDRHAVRLLVKLRRHPPTKKFRENELAEEYELSPHWLRHGLSAVGHRAGHDPHGQ